jgi:hypothetical protein
MDHEDKRYHSVDFQDHSLQGQYAKQIEMYDYSSQRTLQTRDLKPQAQQRFFDARRHKK